MTVAERIAERLAAEDAVAVSYYAASVERALSGRALLRVGTLAAIADCSVDHIDLEIKRGNVELVGEGRRRRVPVESARAWLLGLHERRPVAVRRGV
ncbi:MAG TPA: hypothetical protein VF316_21350 [Polyangiaceae bacterium]